MTDNGKLLFECLHGKTLSALANDMKISVSNLSRVLNGKGCSKAMAERLNNFFNIKQGGFVEEKREHYPSEKKEKSTKPNITVEVKEKTPTPKTYQKPKYERGQFVLYSDGKVGQIRMTSFNKELKLFQYGVRLVEWCRPKEYLDHNQQYNVLNYFNENDIKIISKESIPYYKGKYLKKQQSFNANENTKKPEPKQETADREKINKVVNSMLNLDLNKDIGFKPISKPVQNLLDFWNNETDLKCSADLTPDEKLMILKQIIYKLLSLI